MVELRKRKTPPPAPVRPAKKKAAPKSKVAQAKEVVAEKVEAVKEAVTGKKSNKAGANGESAPASVAAVGGAPTVGATVDLATFGGEVETNEGVKTTLAQLVEQSKSGVVLFTYPKASTPGCTKQACLFRDHYTPLTASGLAIYGLSTDSPKSNTTFQTKQNLPYPLLCDPSQSLVSAIGLKGPKSAKRGVFVVDKTGKVLAAESGSPDGTVGVVRKIVEGQSAGAGAEAVGAGGSTEGAAVEKVPTEEEKEAADTAGEVADTAAKVDA